MAITEMPRFAPSRKPYAFNWSTYEVTEIPVERGDAPPLIVRRVAVEAIWFGRKDGATYVSWGDVGLGARFPDPDDLSVEAFKTHFDPRYGGNVTARWNGSNLWAPGMHVADVVATSEMLDEYLRGAPDVPEGFDGWYSLR